MTRQIIILFGGESQERLVSVASAQNMIKALPDSTLWFWAPNDQVFEVSHDYLRDYPDVFKKEFIPHVTALYPNLLAALDEPRNQSALFFVALHGGRGEGGVVQKWMEERGIGHTGSSSKACEITLDKKRSKDVMASLRVPVAASIVVCGSDQNTSQMLQDFFHRYREIIVKPLADGSSIDLHIVDDEASLKSVTSHILSHPHVSYLVEEFIHGVELTCGVIETEQGLKALPCTEIRKQHGKLLEYDGKYLGVSTTEITPAEISDEATQMAQRTAIAAHEAFNCEGYSRTDLIIQSNNRPLFLEINTLPGLTRASFIPQQLSADGISMRTFLEYQLELAERKSRHKDV